MSRSMYIQEVIMNILMQVTPDSHLPSDWALWLITISGAIISSIVLAVRWLAVYIKKQNEELIKDKEDQIRKLQLERDEFKQKLFFHYDNITPILGNVQQALVKVIQKFGNGTR